MKLRNSESRLVLPWHVNQTLSARERSRVEAALEDDPALAAEHLWLQSLRRSVREDDPATPARSDETGLDELMALVRAERDHRLTPFPSPFSRRPGWWTRGYALAASVILAQAVLLGILLMERPEPLQPLAAKSAPFSGVVLQVVFREQASEGAIRTALRDARGEIVGGPGALGVYRVRVDAADAASALLRLRQNSAVVENAVMEGGK